MSRTECPPARGGTGGRRSWRENRDPSSLPAAQLSLEDLPAARERRDRGHAVATHASDVAWTEAANKAIRDLAASGEPFTAEDLRSIVGPPFGSHNAMGARFMAAAKAGIIRRVGSRQATRPEAAGRWLAVWRGVRS